MKKLWAYLERWRVQVDVWVQMWFQHSRVAQKLQQSEVREAQEIGWRIEAEREKRALQKALDDLKPDPLSEARRLLATADEIMGLMTQGNINQYTLLAWRAEYRARMEGRV